MIKYLYGKSQYLGSFAEIGKGLWFRDLYTMDKLENDKISDDEASKAIELAPDAITQVTIDGRPFKVVPNKPIQFSQSPRRCHVLCLSDRGNDSELFTLFEADICIAINVQKMVELIESANKHLELKVVADSITYYDHENELFDLTQEQLAFFKPVDPYSKEYEYRIAIFWPENEGSKVKPDGHGYVNVFHSNGTANDHITFNFESPVYEEVVVSVIRT